MQEGLMNAKTYMSLILKAPFSDQVLIAGKNTMPSSITTQEAISKGPIRIFMKKAV